MRALPDGLETRRLRLRAPRPDDAAVLFATYTQDADVSRYMIWTPHQRVEETREYIDRSIVEWNAGTAFPYVITTHEGTPIGMIEARLRATFADIGYVLAQAYWRRGLMPEAIGVLAGALLANPRFFRVQAMCDVDNLGSARALEKSGFLREGRLERSTVHPNLSPEPRACFLYARVRA
jgi:ribosomal-protein-alanine N-acetyltransferase